jgi:putative restriction endonuclease
MHSEPANKYGSPWTRDELVLALYLYCQIPFAETRSNRAPVQRLAEILGRTPAAVARKLGNFGAFDPILAAKGITGLTHVGQADKYIWDEFHANWDSLVNESERLLSSAGTKQIFEQDPKAVEPNEKTGPTTKKAVTTVRLYQEFFRRAVLSSYQERCCVCGLDLSELLVASHIIPWASNEKERVNPQNGLCLCAGHDRAFDRGIFSINQGMKIVLSRRARESRSPAIREALLKYESHELIMPRRFPPRPDCLLWHHTHVFLG